MRWLAMLIAVSVLLGGLTGCGSSAGLASPNQPGLVLNHSIGPVKLFESKRQVERALGRGEWSTWKLHRLRYYPHASIYIDYLRHDGVSQAYLIVTRSAQYRTKSNVGVGSTVRQLHNHVPVTCSSGECQVGSANGPGTWFVLSSNSQRVSDVYITVGH